MDNASWVNRIIARMFPNNVKKSYSAVISTTDILQGNVPQEFVATQGNKPSPSGILSHDEAYKRIVRVFPNYRISFVGWTNSMEPFIDYGDLVIEIPYSRYREVNGELRIGEVCTYKYGDMKIIHRFIGKTPDGYLVFKGDNNKRADPPVHESQLVDVLIGVMYTRDKLVKGED